MRKHDRERLAKAERELQRLIDFREGHRANRGAPQPQRLDERIERRIAEVKALRLELGVLL